MGNKTGERTMMGQNFNNWFNLNNNLKPWFDMQNINNSAAEKIIKQLLETSNENTAAWLKYLQTLNTSSSNKELFNSQLEMLSNINLKNIECMKNLSETCMDFIKESKKWTQENMSQLFTQQEETKKSGTK